VRQAIRALGWAIIILWAVTLLLPIMIGFSLLKLSESNAVGFGEPTVSFSNGAFCLSAPFHINNTGYCDLSDMNVTILVGGNNKTILTFSQSLLNVSAGTTLNSSYNISFSLEEIISKSIELLTDDTDLNLSISTFFRMAHIIGLGLSANMTASWGAPFHNLTVSEVSYDFSSQKLSVSANFENHACFTVNGTISLEIYNSRSELIGFTEGYLNVPSDSLFYDLFELTIDPLEMTESGIICIYFENMQIMEKEWGLSE
jgi:hypothetical protein